MNWQKEAIADLRCYRSRKMSIESMTERLKALEDKFGAIRCATTDSTPVMGGASRLEDNLINNIVERQRIGLNIDATRRLVELTEKGLEALSNNQRTVLDKFFVSRTDGYLEWLMENFHMEKSRIYELKDEALYSFTIGMYGVIDY